VGCAGRLFCVNRLTFENVAHNYMSFIQQIAHTMRMLHLSKITFATGAGIDDFTTSIVTSERKYRTQDKPE
jgi:hypothetical protein